MSRRIGVFGGSFDPVHNGHIAVAKSFLRSNVIDTLWVMLSPEPPHKKSGDQASYEHRLKMLELAFAGIKNTVVSDYETELSSPSFTLQTLESLKEKYPDDTFFLCLGEDSISSFESWHKYEQILDEVTLLVAERPGYNHKKLPSKITEKAIFVDHTPVDLSSTEIRSGQHHAAGEIPVPKAVSDYISEHNLY